MTRWLVCFGLAAAVGVTGCKDRRDDRVDVTSPTSGTIETESEREVITTDERTGVAGRETTVSRETVVTKDDFVRSSREQLAEYGRKIDELEDRLDNATADERARLEARISELRAQQSDVEADLRSLDERAETGWEELEGGVRTGLDKLERAFDAAADEIRK